MDMPYLGTPLFFWTSAVASLLVSQPPYTPLRTLVRVTLLKQIADHTSTLPCAKLLLSNPLSSVQLLRLVFKILHDLALSCCSVPQVSTPFRLASSLPSSMPLLKLFSQTLLLPSLQLTPELSIPQIGH